MNENGSSRIHQTHKSNDQWELWHSFMKFLLVLHVVYANLRHSVQMFSQISPIPDLIQKVKRCGLYTGVYGSLPKMCTFRFQGHFYFTSSVGTPKIIQSEMSS